MNNFNISEKTLNKYKNKSLKEIFENIELISNNLGECLKIVNPFGSIEPDELITSEILLVFRDIVKRRLTLINGIGKIKSRDLKKKYLNSIDDLIGLLGPRKYSGAAELVNAISTQNIGKLMDIKPRNLTEEELLFCVKPEEILFLDIETTGQTAGPAGIFLLGIGYISNNEGSGKKFTSELLFAREVSEEAAVLKYFVDILPKFKMFVTYNGNSFDLPFIKSRIATLFEPEEVSEVFEYFKNHRLPKKKNLSEIKYPEAMMDAIISDFIRFDLYYAIRRTYKNTLENFRLITAEESILSFIRSEYLPSSYVPRVYLDWVRNKEDKEKMGGLYRILKHNYYDVINMELLLKEWIITYIEENRGNIQEKIYDRASLSGSMIGLSNFQDTINIIKANFKKRKKFQTLDNYMS
ncbi:MAG: ribonuclease H-like domain-containing protein [Promethearchaeota archaeon]